MTSPLAFYQAALDERGFQADAAQRQAIERLQRLWEDCNQFKQARSNRFKKLIASGKPPRGVYFWGGVGRGKSFLMDAFFHCLGFRRKRRVHFHAFMRSVHEALKANADTRDPLIKVAEDIAHDVRVLCFDEFHVSDIADAMILGRLLDALFARGVVFVMTSNYPPQGLYPNGLQRDQFLPTIALLQRELDVLEVDSGTDYRLRTLSRIESWLVATPGEADRKLASAFTDVATEEGEVVALDLLGRPVQARRVGGGVAWFDFQALCDGPRSQNDYLELARDYHTLLVSNIPCMSADQSNAARRFTWLIDVLYDHRVKLVASAAGQPEALYTAGVHANEFFRTVSRLTEMQTEAYLALPHLSD